MYARRDNAAEPLLVSPTEASRLLGLGRTKLYELIKQGQLASKREGTRRLVSVASIRAYASCGAIGTTVAR